MIGKNKPKILLLVEASLRDNFLGNQFWLGPLYLLSYLEKNGIDADYIDKNVQKRVEINYFDYDIIGFSCNVNNIKKSLILAKEIKEKVPHIQIVFGGAFVSAYPQLLMEESYVDAGVVGEGEETFFEYVSGKPKNEIKGLYYRENGVIHFTGNRERRTDLDDLPFPALHKVKIRDNNYMFSKRLPISYMITTRGCPWRCTFCFHNLGHKWRTRSVENVVDEMQWHVSEFGAREIGIVDENFFIDRRRVIAIGKEIIKRGLKISLQFPSGVRADLIDDEVLDVMKKAGLWVVALAPETGSPRTAERLKKGLDVKHIVDGVALLKKHKIATELYLMIGFPWETKEDYEMTTSMPFDLNVDFATLSRYIPLPGTPLYNEEFDKDKNKVLIDRTYQPVSIEQNDEVGEYMQRFYRQWYSNPVRIIRIIKILRLYSYNKWSRMSLLKNAFCNMRKKFARYEVSPQTTQKLLQFESSLNYK